MARLFGGAINRLSDFGDRLADVVAPLDDDEDSTLDHPEEPVRSFDEEELGAVEAIRRELAEKSEECDSLLHQVTPQIFCGSLCELQPLYF